MGLTSDRLRTAALGAVVAIVLGFTTVVAATVTSNSTHRTIEVKMSAPPRITTSANPRPTGTRGNDLNERLGLPVSPGVDHEPGDY